MAPARQSVAAQTGTDSPKAVVADKTLTKGLAILEALSRSDRPRGVSELAAELALTKSNIHRLLQTLVWSGFVVREHSGDKYMLSSKLWRLSRMHQPHRALMSIARPVLRELVRKTDETATFAVIEGDGVMMIDQIETPRTVRVFYEVGDFQSLDQASEKGLSAIQQIAFAYRPEPDVRRVLQAICKETMRPDAFVREELSRIRQVRKQKYAINKGVWVEDVNAVAAPVETRNADLVGVIVSFGPALRMPDERLEIVRRHTCQAAARLSSMINI